LLRKRIPILDELIDSCRFLPIGLQYFLFTIIGIGISGILLLGFTNLLIIIVLIEIVFILILVYKNSVYHRLSKIDNAIKHRILWIETKKDAEKKSQYLWLGAVSILILMVIYFFMEDVGWLFAVSLLVFLFILKGIFYVPLVFVRLNNGDEIQFSNLFTNQNLVFQKQGLNNLKIFWDRIEFEGKEEKLVFTMEFKNIKERERLEQFLKGLKQGNF